MIMPGFDRTGPQGAGPMTGGARGYCNQAGGGFRTNMHRGGGFGRGCGGNRGFGRGGYGRGYYPVQATPYYSGARDEAATLKAETDNLKEVLNSINERLSALEKKASN